MKRLAIAFASILSLAAIAAAPAQAAQPTLGGLSATNIQGVSALLKGTVDPEGLTTSFYFEYGTSPSFGGASKTPAQGVGSGSEARAARAAISSLSPDTTYHYRLVATNGDGTANASGSFETTHGFGFKSGTEGFSITAIADGNEPSDLAGSHPNELSLDIGLNEGGEFENQPGVKFSDGDLRDLAIGMPNGLFLNPKVVAECSLIEFHTPRVSPFEDSRSGESCPDKSQVGTVTVQSSREGGEPRTFGLFNLAAPPGITGQLGFSPYGTSIAFDIELAANANGTYALSLRARDLAQGLDFQGLGIDVWGVPWAASHNGQRGNCLNEAEPKFPSAKCSVGPPGNNPPLAYVSLPTNCSPTLSFTATASSWQQPGQAAAIALNRDSEGDPVSLGACTSLAFLTQASGLLTNTSASSASGYSFRLTSEEGGITDPKLRAPSPVRKATLTLPDGVTINPSLGAGLGVCTPGQYAAETAFSPPNTGCPNGSKIGDFTVLTTLFDGVLDGSIFLAQPDDPIAAGGENPFDSLLAVYLVAKLPVRGVLVKVAGKLVPNPQTGQLVATFDGLPQLPYTDLNVTFRTGQRAPLITPPRCGPASSQILMSAWGGGPGGNSSTSSPITSGIGGAPCPSGIPPFAPEVLAGGVNSNVNSYTPYFVHIARKDTEQELTSYALELPKGITGKLAGIPFCPEAAIEAARRNRGVAEANSPSCPIASQVGRTLSGYGVGNSLTYANGRVFLAGPYNGQPLSLVTVNSATVGPFDLGTIVIRSAFAVDPLTAQLQIDASASDRIPHILAGIPLHLRDIRIYMDRFEFTHNPSSCAPSALISRLGGAGARFDDAADDSVATSSKHFQLLNCLTLGFKPKLGVRLLGATRRGGYPQLRATFAARGSGDSNLKEIAVTLPQQLFLAQEHIEGICTRIQFNAERCPADSVYGSAMARTPLFDEPLRGDVYLRSSGNKLPDLVASLRAGEIRINLEGKIGPGKNGGIRALFSDLPDQPVNFFRMTLQGGKQGLLTNSADICAFPPLSSVKALAQNNLGSVFTAVLRGQCKGKAKANRNGGGR